MSELLKRFERIVRGSNAPAEPDTGARGAIHPFDERNIHPDIAKVALKLFDDGHYAQATFEAFKYIDTLVSTISGIGKSGVGLMMAAFPEKTPPIQLTPLTNTTERDEQLGFQFMFAGSASGIRNPRGHVVNLSDPIDLCLDHLSMASMLLRRLEKRIAP